MSQHAVVIGTYLAGKTVPQAYTNPFLSASNISVPNRITVNWDDVTGTQNSKLEKLLRKSGWLISLMVWKPGQITDAPDFHSFPGSKQPQLQQFYRQRC